MFINIICNKFETQQNVGKIVDSENNIKEASDDIPNYIFITSTA